VQSHSDETNRTRLIEAIALLDQALEESPATKNCWANRNRPVGCDRVAGEGAAEDLRTEKSTYRLL
jgi:hypothetical protein